MVVNVNYCASLESIPEDEAVPDSFMDYVPPTAAEHEVSEPDEEDVEDYDSE
jgi:hypothetical protein